MKYLLIACTCLIVGFLSYTLSQTNLYPAGDDPWFYATNSLCSTLIAYIVLTIQRSTLTYLIVLIEACAVLVNFFTVLCGLTTDHFFYINYDIMLFALLVIELAVLFYWMPWNGIYSGYKSYKGNYSSNYHWATSSFSPIKTNIRFFKETKKC